VLAVSLLGFGTALLLRPRDRITAESWQKIRIGMTEEEVAEILGGRGENYEKFLAQYVHLGKEPLAPLGPLAPEPWAPLGPLAPVPAHFEYETPSLEEPENKGVVEGRVKVWTGRRGIIAIEFDQDNHVCWKAFRGGRWINQGILDRLHAWLGW
jgi:hypothetical protein